MVKIVTIVVDGKEITTTASKANRMKLKSKRFAFLQKAKKVASERKAYFADKPINHVPLGYLSTFVNHNK